MPKTNFATGPIGDSVRMYHLKHSDEQMLEFKRFVHLIERIAIEHVESYSTD